MKVDRHKWCRPWFQIDKNVPLACFIIFSARCRARRRGRRFRTASPSSAAAAKRGGRANRRRRRRPRPAPPLKLRNSVAVINSSHEWFRLFFADKETNDPPLQKKKPTKKYPRSVESMWRSKSVKRSDRAKSIVHSLFWLDCWLGSRVIEGKQNDGKQQQVRVKGSIPSSPLARSQRKQRTFHLKSLEIFDGQSLQLSLVLSIGCLFSTA